ncbi:hypothetical protein AAVH_24643 [Aphelenchoides avenae]|nr:hypothetical protein AAVH_24643 [Aphelenchus avenae]
MIGPHYNGELYFCNTCNTPGAVVVFEAVPELKYAEEVFLSACSTSGENSEAFMSNFAGMKSFHLCLDNYVFPRFIWTFLHQEAARRLRLIEVSATHSTPTEKMKRSVEGLVHNSASLPALRGGVPLELDFSENYFPREFVMRIIEVST